MKLLIFGLLSLIAAPALAEGFWEYGSWRVIMEEADTGEDLRRTCGAVTGGDGEPSVVISASNGDAGPPAVFPGVFVHEHVPRGHNTVLQDR
ncbi:MULTISPECIES: hypothetical protein [Roseobacteraceae]|uniref:Uncharacterized protein n=1 Tax=Pseudosulfitobacter pseudonitzschiae TaxID=1402135 RepID=A0A221JYS9_9RHOB|nr:MULTISPECIES: hypothetical protein [Roseobacteraceae]ASM71737.1 hypothetical protein SULPSESMR1_00909 [Pseudosulfitobacter pseudonitzschiae]